MNAESMPTSYIKGFANPSRCGASHRLAAVIGKTGSASSYSAQLRLSVHAQGRGGAQRKDSQTPIQLVQSECGRNPADPEVCAGWLHRFAMMQAAWVHACMHMQTMSLGAPCPTCAITPKHAAGHCQQANASAPHCMQQHLICMFDGIS